MIRKLRFSFLFRSFTNRIISSRKITLMIYKLFGYRLLSYLLFFSIEKGNWLKDRPSILCIKRDLFDKDITEMRRRSGKVNWLIVGTPQLAYIQSSWMPKELRCQTVFQKYFLKNYKGIWDKCELFAKRFLELAIQRLNVKAVLSANIDYWQDEGMRRACEAIDIPFLVLSKENCIIPMAIENMIEYYKKANFKFTGDGIAVFSSKMRDVLIKSGVCKLNSVVVTGAPRLDAWRNISHDVPRDTIVLLPYGKDYLLASDDNFYNALTVFLSAAKSNYDSGLHFIIKCKNIRQKEGLSRKLTKGDLKNVNLVVDKPLFDLFPRSLLVIGYNSLALAEALLSDAEIAVPQWGEIGKDNNSQQFNPKDEDCSGVINFIESTNDLERLFERIINGQSGNIDMKKRISLLKTYLFYDPDKSNSEYVEDFVLSFLKKD